MCSLRIVVVSGIAGWLMLVFRAKHDCFLSTLGVIRRALILRPIADFTCSLQVQRVRVTRAWHASLTKLSLLSSAQRFRCFYSFNACFVRDADL